MQTHRQPHNRVLKEFFKKTASFMLAVFLLLAQTTPAFAQDAGAAGSTAGEGSSTPASGAASAEGQTTSEGAASTEAEANNQSPDSFTESGEGAEHANNLSPISDSESNEEDAVSTASSEGAEAGGGMSSSGEIEQSAPYVSGYDGAFTYSYPIDVPQGRNGMEPELSLTYNSNNGHDSDLFGYGWKINIPYIERINKTGTEDLYIENRFYSSLSGELVQIGFSNLYRPRVEGGDFLTYELNNDAWTVYSKDGTSYTFGADTSSRQDDPSDPTRIYKWMLSEEGDTNDNHISYTYEKNQGQIYPESITYAQQGVPGDNIEVRFIKEPKTLLYQEYTPGFLVTTSNRISSVVIDVFDSLTREYKMQYSVGENSKRDVLSSITKQGIAGVDTVTLPGVSFTYQTTGSEGWVRDVAWSLPEAFNEYTNSSPDLGTRPVDVNGDGYMDIVRYYHYPGTVTVKKMYLNNTVDGFVEDTTFDWSDLTLPFIRYSDYSDINPRNDLGSRFIDVNGDGLTDVITAHDSYDSNEDTQKVYLNTGSAWEESGWSVPFYFTRYYKNMIWDDKTRIGDVNGDGLPDVVQAYITDNSENDLRSFVYINTGSGWTLDSSWSFPEPFGTCYACSGRDQDYGTRLIDINNDGLADIVRGYKDRDVPAVQKVYLNTGTGWVLSAGWNVPVISVNSSYGEDTGYRLSDINNDGLTDIVKNYTYAYDNYQDIYINTGTNWSTSIDTNYPPSAWPFRETNARNPGVRMYDINGDDLPDIVHADSEDRYSSGIRDSNVYLNTRPSSDRLIRVTTDAGGVISPTYKSSAHYKNTSGQLLNPDLPYVIDTVVQVTYDPYIGDSFSENYTYSEGVHWSDANAVEDRKFAGFGTITKTSDLSVEKTKYHQGNETNSSEGEYADSFSKIGFPYRMEVLDTSGNKYAVTTTKWDEYVLNGRASFVKRANELTLTYDGNTSHKDGAVAYTYDDTNGSLLTKTEYGEVSGNTNGTFIDVGADTRVTTYTYATGTLGNTGGGGPEHQLLEEELFGQPDAQLFTTAITTSTVSDEATTAPRPALSDILSVSGRDEHANEKAKAILRSIGKGSYERNDLRFEITELNQVDGGIEIFARAWEKGKQVGFGKDGSVDVERFLVFNPPVLVPDVAGDIFRINVDAVTGEKVSVSYREDPKEALLQTLFHVLTVKEEKFNAARIVAGRVGRTTSIVYTESDPPSVGGDGSWTVSASSWNNAHDATSGAVNHSGNLSVRNDQISPSQWVIGRSYLNFDTSGMNGAVPSSATLTITLSGNGIDENHHQRNVALVSFLGSKPDGTDGDFDQVGDSVTNPTEGASRIALTVPKQAGTAYNVSLNAAGIGWINASGVTQLGLRGAHDVDNSAPEGDGQGRAQFYSADIVGTTNDPRLIIEHSEGGVEETGPVMVLPSGVTVTDNMGVKVQEKKFYYDNQPFGSATLGNRTKREDWVAGSTYVDTTWTYNSYGLPTSETDPRGNTTTYAYDPYNLFVATTTNPAGHATAYTYDYSSGKVRTTTDPAGRLFETDYDPLDRPLTEYVPDADTGAQVAKTTYSYTDTKGAVSVQKDEHLYGSTTATTYTYTDGFGRVIQERTEAEATNEFAVRDYVYGSDGLLDKESLPYFSAGTARTAATGNTALYTEYTYDALSRVTSAATAVGNTQTAYDQWTETVTDALGNEKSFTYDAYERLTAVAEHNGTDTYTTSYTWDHNDNLTKITDALGNIRNIAYDGLGRRTLLEDLRDPSDASFGVWEYAYDAAGNLTSATDPKAQTITYTYDALNRVLTEDYTGETGTETTYTYDTCTNGIGSLCAATHGTTETAYTYDNVGNIATESKTIDGAAYTTAYTYDRQGNTTGITYPDASEVRYTFNSANQIERIEQRESGGSFRDVISDVDYGPHGLATYQLHGNGSETTKTYDETALYRLTNIYTTATSTYGTGGSGELAALEIAAGTDPLVSATISATSVPDTAQNTASTTDTVGTTTASVSDIAQSDAEIVPNEATSTAAPLPDQAPESATTSSRDKGVHSKPEPPLLPTDNLIQNAADARAWQRYHNERVAYLTTRDDLPKYVLEKARHGQEVFESYLLKKGYIPEKGANVPEAEPLSLIEKIGGFFTDLVTRIIPRAFAALFASEDFESCSALPCSFAQTAVWGGVSPSLDSTGKVSDIQSLKAVVSGEGAGALYDTGYSTDELWLQFEVYLPSSMSFGPYGYFTVASIEDSAGYAPAWLSIEDWGSPRLTLMGDGLPWTDTGVTLTPGAVHTIEVRVKTGAGGDVDIWVDNSTENAPDYDGSALNTGPGPIDGVYVGMLYAPSSGISTTYYDAISVSDIFIGADTTPGGNSAPSAPSALETEGQTNPTEINTTTPVFTAIYTDTDAGDTATFYQLQVSEDSSFTTLVWDSAQTALTPVLEGTRSAPITYAGSPLASSTLYHWRIKFWDDDGEEGSWSTESATFSLTDSQGTGTASYILYDDTLQSDWANWSWGTNVNFAETTTVYEGTQAIRVQYTGAWTGLNLHTTIPGGFDAASYETLTFWVNGDTTGGQSIYLYINDENGMKRTSVLVGDYIPGGIAAGTWSKVTIPLADIEADIYAIDQLILMSDSATTVYYDALTFGDTADGGGEEPPAPPTTPPFREVVQDLTYTYDAVGNITRIVDASDTQSAATTDYTYDDLYRLTSAQTGGASTTPYTRTYTYDALGNITNKSDQGAYSYEGDTGTRYANPHAVTDIAGTPYTYDRNGNLVTAGALTNTWSYNNRLSQTQEGGTTITYAYDHTGARTKKDNGTEVTRYPSSLYEVQGTNVIKHIYLPAQAGAGDTLVATIEDDTPAPKIYHNHLDHLGSTNAVTDETGYLTQELAYYPFGDSRIDTQYGDTNQTKRFTGHDYDSETNLTYMGARYYDGQTGRFTAQDPVSLALGSPAEMRNMMDSTVDIYLKNPQAHNSYSYTANNPLKYKDKNGEWLDIAVDVGFTAYSAYKLGEAIFTGGDVRGEAANLALDAGGALIPGVVGAGTARRALNASQEGAEWLNKGEKTTDVYIGSKKGDDVYVGISKDVNTRAAQHGDRFDDVRKITPESYTRNQSRAIEQVKINQNPGFQNKINSISPQRSYYQSAINWAKGEIDRISKEIKRRKDN